MKFTKDFLLEMLDDPFDKAKVLDVITESGDHYTFHRRVFKHEGKFFETYFARGSSEDRDPIQPYEDEPDEVCCKEVFEVQKTVTVYE